jgi:hypothetical protein
MFERTDLSAVYFNLDQQVPQIKVLQLRVENFLVYCSKIKYGL